MNTSRLSGIALLLLFAGLTVKSVAATISITDTVLHEHKGWGIFPSSYDRQMPDYPGGTPAWDQASWLGQGTSVSRVMDTVCDLGFDIARVYISPTIGKPDHTLDQTRLQDLKDHLTILLTIKKIPHYFLTLWSPPAYMKIPDRVRYGKYNGRVQYLDTAYADGQGYDFADFYVDVLKGIKAAALPAPMAVSIQNEPSVDPVYDGCVYSDNEAHRKVYRTVVKQLRKKLNDAGFTNVPIIAPEEAALCGMEDILGKASSAGFANMNTDNELKNAVGGFAWHTYATAGNIKTLNEAMAVYAKGRWMTEYSGDWGIRGELRPKCGSNQVNWMLNFVRRMGGDIIDCGVEYWFFWRGWHSAGEIYDQDLVCDGPRKAKAYYPFQRLWKTVRPGWRVMKMTDNDPELRTDNAGLINGGSGDQWSAPVDLVAFESSARNKTCVVLVNNYPSSKVVEKINGLRGNAAEVYVTDSTRNGLRTETRAVSAGVLQGGTLTLPRYSVTILNTAGQTGILQNNVARNATINHEQALYGDRLYDIQGRVLVSHTSRSSGRLLKQSRSVVVGVDNNGRTIRKLSH